MAFLQCELVLGQMELTCCSKGAQRLWWADMKHEAAGSSFNYFSSFLLSWGQMVGCVKMMTQHEMEGSEEKVQVRNQHFLMETVKSGQVDVCCQGKK